MNISNFSFVLKWQDIVDDIREFCERLLGYQRPVPAPQSSPVDKKSDLIKN